MNSYDLFKTEIMNCRFIKQPRREAVFDILVKNNITNADDLINKPIPVSGLTTKELGALIHIKHNLYKIRFFKNMGMEQMKEDIGKFTSNHEQTRIFNLLINNEIYSDAILFATSNKKLSAIQGIGPKSIDILERVKNLFMERKRNPVVERSGEYVAMPLTLF